MKSTSSSSGKNFPRTKLDKKFGYFNNKSYAQDLQTKEGMVRIWSQDAETDQERLKRLRDLTKYPGMHPYVAIMPDYHLNGASMNGSVIPSPETLYVSALGGDLGCGVASLELPVTTEQLRPYLNTIFKKIYSTVPCGRRSNSAVDEEAESLDLFNADSEVLTNSVRRKALLQLGTIGDGNHFAEIQSTGEGKINLMVHSGSRGLGQIIRLVYTKKGVQGAKGVVSIAAETDDGRDYLKEMNLALSYAVENRKEILRRCVQAVAETMRQELDFETMAGQIIDLPHNYVCRETHFGEELYVHRKGAIHVPKDSFGLVPGSMGTSTYKVIGRGNQYSFESCSHGAGRQMSRGEALANVTRIEFEKTMEGVLSRTDDSIYDESPSAYKDIEKVMRAQRDLVAIADRFTPLASIKG